VGSFGPNLLIVNENNERILFLSREFGEICVSFAERQLFGITNYKPAINDEKS
jgi:hypothetical protein